MRTEVKYCVIGAAAVAVLAATMPAESQPQLRGTIQVDYAIYDEDATPLNDAIRVRRARLGATGRLDDNWSYLSEVDLAENAVDYKDMWLRRGSVGGGALTIGQLKVPFSMDELTSSSNMSFMERASPNIFALSRRIGIHWGTSGSDHTFAVMGFGQAIGGGDGGDEGLGIGARATYVPFRTDGGLFHVGAALVNYEPAHSNNPSIQFQQRPESRPDGSRLVNTGAITNADSAFAWGVEGAWQHGPLVLQGEYMSTRVKRDTVPNASFDGWYVQAGYFLTGDRRSYSGGVFGGPSIANAERGAWELAVRYSNLDLNDAGAGIAGGEMKNLGLGVNWYPRSNVRFMLNFINVDSELAGVDNDPSIIQVRAQIGF